jgi:hypothetical protein
MYLNKLAAKLLFGLALILISQLSWGQGIPSYSPPPIPAPMGSMGLENTGNDNPYYREGHRAEKMRFDGSKLMVKGANPSKLFLDKLRCLEIGQDTFLVLKTLPGRAVTAQKPEALEVAYSHRGTQLLCLYYEYRVLYFLQRPGRSLQLLPTDKTEFKKAMLAIVQDCPVVAAQVAAGTLGRREAARILQTYDACR